MQLNLNRTAFHAAAIYLLIEIYGVKKLNKMAVPRFKLHLTVCSPIIFTLHRNVPFGV